MAVVSEAAVMQCRSYITPVDQHLIPTGAFLPVTGTPYNLNNSTCLSHNIHQVCYITFAYQSLHCTPMLFLPLMDAGEGEGGGAGRAGKGGGVHTVLTTLVCLLHPCC